MSDESRRKKVWLCIGATPTLIVIGVALLAPLDVLDKVPVLDHLLQFLSRYVPSLSAYVALSAHSQVAATFFVLGWILLPLQTVAWLYVMHRYGDFGVFARGETELGRTKMTVASGVLSLCIFIVLFWIPKEWSIAESWGMNKSRLGLAFFGSGGFLFVAVGFSFVVISVINFFRGK